MMKPLNLVLYALMAAVAFVAITQPFNALGERLGPGVADLLNGGVAMGLLLATGAISLVALKRRAK